MPADRRPDPAPTDLRLVPAALAAWLAAALGVAAGRGVLLLAAAACASGALAALVAVVRGRRGRARHRGRPLRPPAAAVLLACATTAAVLLTTTGHTAARDAGLLAHLLARGASAELTGRVATEPRVVAGGPEWSTTEQYRLRLDVTGVRGQGRHSGAAASVVVIGGTGWADLVLGELVTVRATPRATGPGEEEVALVFTDRDPAVIGPPPGHLRVVNSLRAGLREVSADLPDQARGLVPGIAVGDDRALQPDLADDMRATSLTHLTAVSGAHVAILLGCVLGALAWAPRPWRLGVSAVALLAFVTLVRPEPSVLRSAVMGAAVIAALALGRPARALPGLGAAVVVLLLLDPWLARSYGFALSVLATAGLVLLARPWTRWLSHLLPRWAATALAVPAAAQAACAPVLVLLTPALSVYAVPANVLAAPAVPPATLLGVGATLLAPLWPAGAGALAWAASWCTAWIAAVARTLAGLPGAQLPWPGGTGGAAALAGVTVVVLALLARTAPQAARPRRGVLAGVLAGAVAVAVVAALAVVPALGGRWVPRAVPAGWTLVQCDVGQGAGVLLRSGPAAAVMVDVGPAGRAAATCLEAAGVRTLDLLVLTHAHADHVGGLPAVLTAVDVERALLGPGPEPAATVTAVLDQLADAGVPVARPLADGDAAAGSAGDVGWEALWPDAAAVSAGAGINDLSLVVRLTRPGTTLLPLGDVELDGQAGLLRRMRGAGVGGADVVVMAHHGSARQDPALAAHLRPRLTLVSVGADNDYGHPAASALDLYASGGGAVVRTDLCGRAAVVAGEGGDLGLVTGCPARG